MGLVNDNFFFGANKGRSGVPRSGWPPKKNCQSGDAHQWKCQLYITIVYFYFIFLSYIYIVYLYHLLFLFYFYYIYFIIFIIIQIILFYSSIILIIKLRMSILNFIKRSHTFRVTFLGFYQLIIIIIIQSIFYNLNNS